MAEEFRTLDRKVSRRTILRAAVAGLALPAASALLAACGGGGATPTPTSAPAAQTPAAAATPAAGQTPAAGKEVVLAILHFSVIEGTTWSGAHDRAGKRLAEKYPNVKYIYREQVSPDQTVPFAEEMIAKEGANIIVGNAEFIGMPLLDIVDKYPDKIFVAVTTSDLTTRPNFIRIFPRQYQSLYLEGLIAAALTKTGNVGIVSAYPNLQVLRRQAGFILGVQEAAKKLNKDVKIHIKYVGDWYLPAEERAVAETLATQYNCDVLTQQTDSGSTLDVCKARGLWFVGKDMDTVCFYKWATTDTVAISFDTRWEVIYDKIIQAYLKGEKPPEIIFPGMESSITLADGTEVTTTDIMNDCKVGIDAISPKAKAQIPQEIIDLVAERREGMRKGEWDPFTEHALVSNGTGLEVQGLPIPPKGTVVKPAGEKPTDEFLLQKINFDLEGVNILP
ncbi:MAG: BMP family ABC transporter substrate-binding protein [Thermomicrobium sp.]|nr:BMP family ABC transporter substrate-binding protein [Thermomicrobium sp.]MDW8059404.1 BMP family ABC transporter substrate-binding protein [Thermomicrobium sp.]